MVTVVVPTYNVEKYILKCLISIQKQTYNDFECLVVIDGSKDKSSEIAKKFAKEDPRFKVYEKENGGYGSVLEYAIKNIDTKYFLICDPDDYLELDALEELVELSNEYNSDITIGTRNIFYEGSDKLFRDSMYDENIVKIRDGLYKSCDLDFEDVLMVDCSPHSKMYKTSSVVELNYPKKISYTDNILFYTSINNSRRIVFTSKPYSNYLQNREGNSVTQLKSKYIREHIIVYKFILNYLENCEEVNNFIYFRLFDSFKVLFYNYRFVECSSEEKKELKAELFSLLKKLLRKKEYILKYQKKYSSEGNTAKFKNKLLLNGLLSRLIFNAWLKDLEG